MHKSFKWIVSLIIALVALPMMSGAVFAEDGESYNNIKDGEYDITVEALHAKEDKASGVASSIDSSANLMVKDSQVTITIAIVPTDQFGDVINGLQLEGQEPIKEDKNDDAVYKTYEIDNLSEFIIGQVQYEIPNIHEGDEPFRLHITNLDELLDENNSDDESEGNDGNSSDDPKGDEEQPEEDDNQSDEDQSEDGDDQAGESDDESNGETPKGEDGSNQTEDKTEEEPTKSYEKSKDSNKLVPDEAYKIDFRVNKDGIEKESSAADHMKDGVLLVKDGQKYIQLTLTEWGMIDYLGPTDGDVYLVKENKNSAVIQFKVDGNLSDLIKLKMSISTPIGPMNHKADLFLDPDSKEAVDSDNYQLVGIDNSDGLIDDDPSKKKKDTDNENPEATKSNDGPKVAKTDLKADQAFKYNFVIKHATEDKTSAADRFFKKPAHVLYKDGEKYMQLTVTNWDWITSLQANGNDVFVVKKNNDGSVVVQFKIDGDLSDAVILDMHVEVPKEVAGMPYDMDHQARLFLDLDSKEEVDADDFKLSILDDGSVTNPKTGDTSSMWLYVLLLAGSAVPLAVKIKRRFA